MGNPVLGVFRRNVTHSGEELGQVERPVEPGYSIDRSGSPRPVVPFPHSTLSPARNQEGGGCTHLLGLPQQTRFEV